MESQEYIVDRLSGEKSRPQFTLKSMESLVDRFSGENSRLQFVFKSITSQEYNIVDRLSGEKSRPQFRSSNQQYESHKPQYESRKQHYENKPPANSYKPPTQFYTHDSSVPRSTKAQRRLFYRNLGNRYLALGQHSKVAECQLKLIDDVQKCKRENCSYKEIGEMYYNIDNYAEAAKFFELSLENDDNDLISEAIILSRLLTIYKSLQGQWLWISKEEQHTLSRMASVCHKLMKEEDKVIFRNWITIITIITAVNENVDFLEERLFTVMSTPNKEFQLKPQDALVVVKVIEQSKNDTKTVLWGSFLLQPFVNYNNFSGEEKVDVLQIYLSTSIARIKLLQFSEGLDGIEHVYKTIEQSLELQDYHGIHEIYSTVCFYLIVRLKYVMPCYRDYLTAGALYNIPTNIVYIVFVVPFEFSSEIEANKNDVKLKGEEPRRPSTAIEPTDSKMFGFQIVEDIVLSAGNDFEYMVQSTWFSIYSKYWHPIQIAFFSPRFIINVITVAIRLWVLCAFFAFLITVSLVLCSVVLEAILAPLYMSVALSPILPQSARELFIVLCDLLIFLSKVQVQLLRNQVGFPWLSYYILFSENNLAQLYPFDYDCHLSVYKYKINNRFFYFVSIHFLLPWIKILFRLCSLLFHSVVTVSLCCLDLFW